MSPLPEVNPDLPETLFKYVTPSTALAMLRTGSIRAQSPLRFNEPLDSMVDPLWNLMDESTLSRLRNVFASEFARADGRVDEEVAIAIRDFGLQEVAKAMERSQLAFLGRARVLCLTTDRAHPLMWAHYSQEHHGAVFEFDTRKLAKSFREAIPAGSPEIRRVSYVRELPIFITEDEFTKHIQGENRFDKLRGFLGVKGDRWRDEDEFRLIAVEPEGSRGDYRDIAFPPSALVSVTRGCRMSTRDWVDARCLALSLNPNVEFLESRPNSQFLRFDTEPEGL